MFLASSLVPAGVPSLHSAELVMEDTCVACHAAEHRAWSGSQHARAMQPAQPNTVLADFGDRRMEHDGSRWRFFREGPFFLVETEDPDGRAGRFEVHFTFGVSPLQQYLAATPGGRLQALPWAWDVQRGAWFHLLPDETALDHRHPLHWTALPYNANTNCVECHTTGYRKQYDAAADIYRSRWHQGNVGCQACHGPASDHLAWTRSGGAAAASDGKRRGFAVDLRQTEPPVQTETCAACHALREPLGDPAPSGARLMDAYLPALLSPGLYFPDGQQQDEVFVYGSWLQSRMHAAGVRCTDCHDPHSGRPRASGNELCTRCHNAGGTGAPPHVTAAGLKPARYDDPSHHGHATGTPGSRCVDCHAPARTYMRIDPRRDHRFGVPRPDLAAVLGVPDVCTGCHADREPTWAAAVLAQRRLGVAQSPDRAASAARAIAAGRAALPGAVSGLLALVDDPSRPGVVRATALELLRPFPGSVVLQRQVRGLGDSDPLVRRVAAGSVDSLAPGARWRALAPLLTDPVRAVRFEAARQLAGLAGLGTRPERERLDHILAEYAAGLRQQADKPNALLALGNLHRNRGELNAAEAAWQEALRRDQRFVPAWVNRADLLRQRGLDRDGEMLLREALAHLPGDAGLTEALVLTRVRLGDLVGAKALVDGAAARAGTPARLGYLEALLLDAQGRRDEAVAALETLRRRHPSERDALLQLAAWLRESGQTARADELWKQWREVHPLDPALRAPSP